MTQPRANTFGDIRSIVLGAPSWSAWVTLLESLRAWPDKGSLEHEVLPYVRSHIDRWPDEARALPRRWAYDLGTEALPGLDLVRTLEWPTSLKLLDRMGAVAEIHQMPLKRLRLSWQDLRGDDVERLMNIGLPPGLEELDLSNNALLGDDVLRMLSRGDAMFTRLKLSNNPLTQAPSAPEELSLRGFARITHLELSNIGSVAELRLLALCRALEGIRSLDVSRNALTGPFLARLFEALPAKLESLNFSTRAPLLSMGVHHSVDSRTLETVVEHPGAAGLRSLNVNNHVLGDDGLAQLLGGSSMRRLTHLSVSNTNLSTRAGALFAQRDPARPPLTSLHLARNALHDDGVKALLEAPTCAHLEHLSLRGTRMTLGALDALFDAPCWGTLRRLELNANALGDEGARRLARTPPPPRCTALHLTSTRMGTDGLRALLGSPWLDQLEDLRVS
ncbi:MAG: hypothetical protein AAGI01_17755, partial [Myxococcota bacterium]